MQPHLSTAMHDSLTALSRVSKSKAAETFTVYSSVTNRLAHVRCSWRRRQRCLARQLVLSFPHLLGLQRMTMLLWSFGGFRF